MGSGSKEKSERLAARTQLITEFVGLRILLLLLFSTMILFTLSLAASFSLSLDSPQHQQSLLAELNKEARERQERWKKRHAEQLAMMQATGEVKEDAKKKQEGKDLEPEWATRRVPKKVTKKKLRQEEEEEDEFGEEDAELEIRTRMGEWMREVAQSRAQSQHEESQSLIALRKRQKFVEAGIDVVTSRDAELDEFDLASWNAKVAEQLAAEDSSSEHSEEDGVDTEEVVVPPSTPYLGVSGQNDQTKAMRSANFFSAPAFKQDKMFAVHLQHMGYTVSSTSGSKQLPLWVIAYGTKCPDEVTSTLDRHIFICPRYLPTAPGARYLPLHLATRSPKTVMTEVLARSNHKRGDGVALSQALVDVYLAKNFVKESFRLFKDRTKLESHLARESERRPIFALSQNDGTTQPQLTDNVAAILQGGEKKYGSKQFVLRRYSLNPPLWQDRKFVIRSYAMVFSSNPLMVLYLPGWVLRAPEPFSRPATGAVESSPTAVHFPGLSSSSTRLTLRQLQKSTGRDMEYISKRMKHVVAYSLLSLGVAGTSEKEDKASSLVIQHICFDFVLEPNERNTEDLLLDAIRTDCPLESDHHLVDWVNVLGEEILVKKAQKLPYSFAALPSFQDFSETKLEVLFDEASEKSKEKSLLDVLERYFTPQVDIHPKQMSMGVTDSCPNAKALLRGSTGTRKSYQAAFPSCSTQDLDALFSTEAVVLNGEEVDAETFFNEGIEASLTKTLEHLWTGNYKSALRESLLAGYSPCRRLKGGIESTIFSPVSKGLSPFALKTFACGADTTGTKDLLLEIPHPFFDHTRKEGLELFDSKHALGLVISGTHRCAVADFSECTSSIGKSVRTNCNGRDAYQNGDVAHSVKNTFWTVHMFLSKHIDLVVSLHSTKQDVFIISDGTSGKVESSTPVAKIGVGLAKTFPKQIVACNEYFGRPNERSLSDSEKDVCGATNVQGRHMNGATDPCRAQVHEDGSPLQSSGRFVHIEQPVALVRQPTKLVEAMELALAEFFGE